MPGSAVASGPAPAPGGRVGPGDPARGTAIRATGVSLGYGGRPLWSDATFRVRRGEFVAVIGPNGAGKTSLFRLLLGLHPSMAGSLEVLGGPPRRGDSRIGYVPQRHAIDYETHVRSLDLVRLGFAGHRFGLSVFSRPEREAATDALASVGATDLGDRPLSALSGGELQRIYLAEALVSDPELLLLDEPLSNLDLRRAAELASLVHRTVQARGIAALLVAHDINPLVAFLDQVIYVANGRVATGPPDAVLTSATLSELYGVPVEVLRDSRGRIVIVGGDDHAEGEITGGEDHHEGEGSGGRFGPAAGARP